MNIPCGPGTDQRGSAAGPGKSRQMAGRKSCSPDPQQSESSYDDDSFETAEESFLADGKSSHVVWGKQESVFLAKSSTSSGEERRIQKSQAFSEASISESYETVPSESIAESESVNITEECGYSDEFESLASLTEEAEEELSTKDETISERDTDEGQEIFIRKKLEVLLSHQTRAKTQNFEKRDENKMIAGHSDMNNFCSRKLKTMAMNKHKTDGLHDTKHMVMTAEQPVSQPIAGNKRKIESLKVENLMNKTEKLKQKDFHDPRHCRDCRTMKSDIAKHTFLKRKLEMVKREEFEDRLQTHVYQKDSATLIAEIVNSCIKATAPASEMWEKLLHK